MSRQILFGQDALQKLLNGTKVLADTVTTTLGPLGKNVIIERKFSSPIILHDGVKVAKEIELKDPFENMGAQLLKEAAEKSGDRTGDGTTTATLLGYELVKRGVDKINANTNPMVLDNVGVNPMTLKKGIDQAVKDTVELLKQSSKPLTTKEEIAQVATISSTDPIVGKLIAEAIEKVGRDGIVTAEEGVGITTEVEYKEGMEIDKGFQSPYLVTNTDKMEAEIGEPFILVTDLRISSAQDIFDFLVKFKEGTKSKDLMIIGESVDGEALAALVVNRERDALHPLAIPAPAIGDRRRSILEDIAILTGATFISKEKGDTLENVTIDKLGRAEKVWADTNRCRIIGGKGDKKAITDRIKQIKNEIEKTTSEFEKEKLQERVAKLSGGVAVIKVGAQTEIEMKEKLERVIDAIEATRAATAEGIVPGGGVALYQCSKKLVVPEDQKKDFQEGYRLVIETLSTPLQKILENAGVEYSSVKEKIDTSSNPNYGYDVVSEQYDDLYTLGIIDPVKVTRMALENAASVASMILTGGALVADQVEDKKNSTEENN